MPNIAPEDRERIELRSKARLTSYVQAALEQRAVADVEADFNAACNISGNRFPLELLAPPEQRAEQRAKSQVATDAAWTIGVTELRPKRIIAWLNG